MSHLKNADSLNPKQGSFKPSVAPDGPMTEKGHQPGRKVNEADQRPEFHLESHPPGTAPASSSYTPNTVHEVGGQANNPNVLRGHGKESVQTTAADTLMGATSADVHTGMGKPLQGQTNVELAHDGAHGRKKQPAGLEGVGASREDHGMERKLPDQRGYEKEQTQSGRRGNKGERAAEDMEPEPAETLDKEWNYEPTTKRNK
ncbi:uncharacterized protein N7482_006313 [Penicillium canariense]|uniref:Uncharacterized protein n=1 Tax=Penicillium canariense TaxID=189055 RepID=A0A9W9LNC9_9EURO|nr:uncharacterized protein N7482_006313 [Penicillium canariense]KAJ5167532.1 hypothetical protein N7482_006313 [Penicillium canariense]